MTRAPLSRRTVCSSRMARIAESGLLLPAEEALIHSQIVDMQKGPVRCAWNTRRAGAFYGLLQERAASTEEACACSVRSFRNH